TSIGHICCRGVSTTALAYRTNYLHADPAGRSKETPHRGILRIGISARSAYGSAMQTVDKYLELAQILRTRADSEADSVTDRRQKLQLAEQLEWLAKSEIESGRATAHAS